MLQLICYKINGDLDSKTTVTHAVGSYVHDYAEIKQFIILLHQFVSRQVHYMWICCSLRYRSSCGVCCVCRVSVNCVWTVVHPKDVQGWHSVHSDRDSVHSDHHTRHKIGHPWDLHPDWRSAVLPTTGS